jgi:hypothetical protein
MNIQINHLAIRISASGAMRFIGNQANNVGGRTRSPLQIVLHHLGRQKKDAFRLPHFRA